MLRAAILINAIRASSLSTRFPAEQSRRRSAVRLSQTLHNVLGKIQHDKSLFRRLVFPFMRIGSFLVELPLASANASRSLRFCLLRPLAMTWVLV